VNGISVPIKRLEGAWLPFFVLHPCGDEAKGIEPSPNIESIAITILNFPIFRHMRNKFLFL
jgi:hypothetical protein